MSSLSDCLTIQAIRAQFQAGESIYLYLDKSHPDMLITPFCTSEYMEIWRITGIHQVNEGTLALRGCLNFEGRVFTGMIVWEKHCDPVAWELLKSLSI